MFRAHENLSHLETLDRLSRDTVRVGMALGWLDTWFLAGIGLGLAFPEEVEKMWRAHLLIYPSLKALT